MDRGGGCEPDGLKQVLEAAYGWRVHYLWPAGRVLGAETAAGFKCVKRSALTSEGIVFCDEALSHLRTRGFGAAVPPLHTLEGAPFVECGGLRYTVMNWVEGRELDYGRAGDIETAAALIAGLHRATAGFRPESAPKGRIAHGTWLERFRGRLDQLSALVDEVRGRRTLDSFDQLFLSLAPGGIRAGEEALAVLASSEYRRVAGEARDRGAFCHHDTAHHNFLTGPSGTWIIDFDYLLCDTPLHDVGSLMRRGLKARGWGVGAAWAVLRAYAAEGDLPRGWARILRGFLRWPQELWRLSTQRYAEELPWPFARFMSRLEEYAANLAARERCLAELGDELEFFEAEHCLDRGAVPREGGGP